MTSIHTHRLTRRLGRCFACERPVAAHFDSDNTYIGCLPLHPMRVTLPNGSVRVLRTVRDVYRVAAITKKVA